MGSLLHPVGSLPPGVYWFRRSLLAGLVIVTALGVYWAVGGFDGQRSAASTPPGSTAPPSQSATTSGSSSPAASHTPTSSPSTAASHAPCPDSVIRVLAVTSQAAYPAGTPVELTVQVTNTSSVPCARDLGLAALEQIVYSGHTRVWSSADCNPGGGHALVTLSPGQTFSSTVRWDRHTSAPGCPSGRPQAAAGAYQLVARTVLLLSAPAPFSLG